MNATSSIIPSISAQEARIRLKSALTSQVQQGQRYQREARPEKESSCRATSRDESIRRGKKRRRGEVGEAVSRMSDVEIDETWNRDRGQAPKGGEEKKRRRRRREKETSLEEERKRLSILLPPAAKLRIDVSRLETSPRLKRYQQPRVDLQGKALFSDGFSPVR